MSFSSTLLEEIDQDSSGILVDAFGEQLENPLKDYSDKREGLLVGASVDSSINVGVFINTSDLLKLASAQHPFWLEAFNEHAISLVINFSSSDTEEMFALSLVILDRSLARAQSRSAFFAIDAQRGPISENSMRVLKACSKTLLEMSAPSKEEGFCCLVDFDYARQHEGTLAPWYYVWDSQIFAFEHATKYMNELDRRFCALDTAIQNLANHEFILASALESLVKQAPSRYQSEESIQ